MFIKNIFFLWRQFLWIFLTSPLSIFIYLYLIEEMGEIENRFLQNFPFLMFPFFSP